MQIVSLLILIALLVYVFKCEKSPYSRMIIGSVFGIVFFSIWPLINYYIELHSLPDIYHLSAFVIISLVATLLSFLLVKVHLKLLIAGISFSLFIIFSIISFTYQSKIKNFIAINSSYFSSSTLPEPVNTLTNRTTQSSHNYSYSLASEWRKKTDKGSLFEYYELYKDNIKQIEFRPRCFVANNTALSELVNNLTTLAETRNNTARSQCYEIDQSYYACKIDNVSVNGITRIIWLRVDTGLKYGMELDFVLFNQLESNTIEINTIIQSALFNNADSRDFSCLTLNEWI